MTNPSHEDALAAKAAAVRLPGRVQPGLLNPEITQIIEFLEAASRKLPTRKAYAAQRRRNKAKRKKAHA